MEIGGEEEEGVGRERSGAKVRGGSEGKKGCNNKDQYSNISLLLKSSCFFFSLYIINESL